MTLEIKNIASSPRTYDKKGAPHIGLYFTSPHEISGYEFPVQLGHAFRAVNNSIYEKNLHAMELDLPGASEAEYAHQADLIGQLCKNSGIAFIVNSHTAIARQYQADGIIFNAADKPDLKEIRAEFGEDFIIGINCKGSKTNTEKYAKNPLVDFVSFDYHGEKTLELVKFWKKNSENPCVVKGYIDQELCVQLINYGVDFIGCGDYLWEKKDKVAEAVEEINEAIEQAITPKNIQ